MGRKGLEEAAILREAVLLIAEEGLEGFSLRGLARRLHVQSASLYNHVSSLEKLLIRVARRVMDEMNRALYRALEGRAGDEAVTALFHAYRDYVHANPEVYRVVLALPRMEGEAVAAAAAQITGPVQQVLEDYGLTPEAQVHCQRYLRSLMHGFATLENRGYLSHMEPPAGESYEFLITCALEQLHRMEGGGLHG